MSPDHHNPHKPRIFQEKRLPCTIRPKRKPDSRTRNSRRISPPKKENVPRAYALYCVLTRFNVPDRVGESVFSMTRKGTEHRRNTCFFTIAQPFNSIKNICEEQIFFKTEDFSFPEKTRMMSHSTGSVPPEPPPSPPMPRAPP